MEGSPQTGRAAHRCCYNWLLTGKARLESSCYPLPLMLVRDRQGLAFWFNARWHSICCSDRNTVFTDSMMFEISLVKRVVLLTFRWYARVSAVGQSTFPPWLLNDSSSWFLLLLLLIQALVTYSLHVSVLSSIPIQYHPPIVLLRFSFDYQFVHKKFYFKDQVFWMFFFLLY